MKLYLHWLRHDLHRFRLMLAVWVALLAAYAAFLCWAHLHILTVSQDALDWSKPMAIAMGLIQCGLLFILFNSDPAQGVHHFWKTRPPSGVTIAAVKLTISIGFFLILPSIAWQVVRWIGLIPGFELVSHFGLSWAGFLFWTQSVTIGVFALAAAGSGDAKTLWLRLLAVAGILSLVFVASTGFADLVPLPAWYPGWMPYRSGWMPYRFRTWLEPGIWTLPLPAMWLLAGSAVFVCARRANARLAKGWLLFPVLPAAIPAVAAALYKPPGIHPLDESLPAAQPEMAQTIRLGNPQYFTAWLSWTDTNYLDQSPKIDGDFFPKYDRTGHSVAFTVRTSVEGMPTNWLAAGRWLNLILTAEDGTQAAADPGLSRARLNVEPEVSWIPDTIRIKESVFPSAGLKPLFGKRCIAEGVVRLTLYRPHIESFNLEVGPSQLPGLGPIEYSSLAQWRTPQRPGNSALPEFFAMEFLSAPRPRHTRFFLRSPMGQKELQPESYAQMRDFSTSNGFFIPYCKNSYLPSLKTEPEGPLRKAVRVIPAALLPAKDWTVRMIWNEPSEFCDIPVRLENVNFPFQEGNDTWPTAPSPVSAPKTATESPATTPASLRTMVARISTMRVWGSGKLPPEQRWRIYLATISRDQLSLLVELYTDLPKDMPRDIPFRAILKDRIAELAQPGDLHAMEQQFPGLPPELRAALSNPAEDSSGATRREDRPPH